MVGLLDFLANAATGGAARGLLSGIETYGPDVLNFYKNQTTPESLPAMSQFDTMGGFTGAHVPTPPSAAPAVPYPQGTDPMTAGGLPPQSRSPVAPQAAPLSQGAMNPIAIGDYQMPRIGSPDLFQPQAAPTDVSAQSRQPQQSAPLPQSSLTNNTGGLSAGLRGFANNLHNGPIGALIGGVGSALGAEDPAQQNLRAQFSVLSQLVGPQKAMIAILNPKAGESIFAEAFGNKEPPKTVEEFMVRNAWQNRNNPGTSANGLPTTMQALQEYKANEKAAEKKATTIAEKQGEMSASLPDTLARAEQTIKQIDELKGHQAKSYRTGFPSIAPAIPGFSGVDFDERVKQLKGGAFLDAYKMLRGTGAISETEGAKAEQAQARLSQAKSTKEFDQALDDLRQVVVDGYSRAQKMAGEEKIKPYEMPVGHTRTIGGVTIKRVN